MKILLLNDSATPSGGAEILTIALRHEFRKSGHDARILASSAQYGPQPIEADYTCRGTTSALRTINRVANLSAYKSLRRILKQFKPDVVHVRMFTTQLSPSILPLLKDRASVYHATWCESVCPIGLKLLPNSDICTHRAGAACFKSGCVSAKAWPLLMAQLHLNRKWIHVFDQIIANSNWVRESLEAENIGPIKVIRNGVPLTAARPALQSPPTVAYCGRLSTEKGCNVLLHAFREVLKTCPDAQLQMIGDGEERSNLVKLAQQIGISNHVTFHGHLTRRDAEQTAHTAWVQAVPSLCNEGFGLVAAEALMRGTAVVASQGGGLREIVDDGQTGRLVARGDHQAIAEALLMFVTNRDLAETYGREARLRATTQLSQKACADAFLNEYRRIIKNREQQTNRYSTVSI